MHTMCRYQIESRTNYGCARLTGAAGLRPEPGSLARARRNKG